MSRGTPPPDPLYKYARRADAAAMLERATFRIGTLYEYRDVEKHGPEVGDVGEATRTVSQYVGEGETWEKLRKSSLISELFNAEADSDIKISNSYFEQIQNFPDAYIFCVSIEPTEQALQDFGKDVCLRISTPLQFFLELGESLFRAGKIAQGGGWFAGPVAYVERGMQYGKELPIRPALHKPPRYSYQKEYRAVWIPASLPIKPEFVSSPSATTFLRLHDL
jgi:hypothetical protein